MSCKKAISCVEGTSKTKRPSRFKVTNTTTRSSLNSSVSSLTSDCSEKTPSTRKASSATVVINDKFDELKVGDRVFVDGELPGVIRFLDKTNFASGKWAGVELDDEAGKNDGSVCGVRYFQCKPKHGLFIRPDRATIRPLSPHSSDELLLLLFSDEFENESVASSTNSVPKSVSPQIRTSNLKVGDKVVVNTTTGLKEGVLKFLGETKFAAGVWAGIHLDDPSGKNDGSVSGVRYFDCEPSHGLFVHIKKVAKVLENVDKEGGSVEVIEEEKTTKQSNAAAYQKSKHGDLLTARLTGLSGSIESLNSIANRESQKAEANTVGRIMTASNEALIERGNVFETSSQSPYCETLNEKEAQITNLLNERESERSENALKFNELDEKLAAINKEHQQAIKEKVDEIIDLKEAVEEGNRVHKELLLQINEERRRVEVVEYRLEEEMLNNLKLKEEMEKIVRDKSGYRNEQSEFIRKTERIFQLESNLEAKKQEVMSLQGRIREVEEQCKIAERKQMTYLETIDELNLKISKSDSEARKVEIVRGQLEEELQQLREDLVILKNKLSKKDEFLDVSDKLQKKDAEIADMSVHVKSLRKQIDFLNEEKEALADERKKSEKLLRDKMIEIDMFKRENSELQQSLIRIEKQKCDLEQEIEVVARNKLISESELNLLRNETKEKENKILQLIETSKRKDDEIENLKREYLKRISEKEEELNTSKDKESQLREYITKTEEERRAWQQQVDEVLNTCDKFSNKEKDDKTLTDELRSLNSQLSKMESDLLRYSEEASDLTVMLTKKNEEIETLNRVSQDSNCSTASDSLVSALRENIKDLQTENRTLIEELEVKEKQKLELQQKVCDLNKHISISNITKKEMLQQLNSTKSMLTKKESELSEMSNSRFIVTEQIEDLKKQIQSLEETNNELSKEKENLSVECLNHKNGVYEKDEMIRRLREQLDTVCNQLDDCRQKFEIELKKSKSFSEFSSDELKITAQTLQRENELLEAKNRDLNSDVTKVREELNTVGERYRETLLQFETECKRLEKIIDEKNALLEKKESCLRQMTVDNESMVETIKKKVEVEKDKLMKKIFVLESSLNEHSSGKCLHSQKGAEKETYESQIDFLNSVIVDMQKKNDDLRAKIQILEEIGVTDFGQHFAEQDVNGHARPSRVFCEICDAFDAHYTKDCPLQSGELQDLNPHFIQQILRPERPFCRTCRTVGHWTDACQSNRVF